MKSGASRGRGGRGLHRHWTKARNERIEVLPPRDLAAEDLPGQLQELAVAMAHARFSKPIWHLWCSPNPRDRKPTETEVADYWRRIEAEFRLDGQPDAAVRHALARAGAHHPDWIEDTHEHRAYGLADERGRMVDALRHERIRRQRINAEWEYDHGFELTPLKHVRAVLAWLDRHRPEVAAALRAAGHDERPAARIAAVQPDARACAERGVFAPRELQAILRACWLGSRTGAGFVRALADYDLNLAMGDQVPVVVDAKGVAYPLRRTLAAGSRAAGSRPITAAEVEARLRAGPTRRDFSLAGVKIMAPPKRNAPMPERCLTFRVRRRN